jgi:hypothetical protein
MYEKKLIKIYNEASKYFNNNSNKNQKSKHWKRYDTRKFSIDNLINFRNSKKLSAGLDDHNDNFTFKFYSEVINQISELYVFNNLPKKMLVIAI